LLNEVQLAVKLQEEYRLPNFVHRPCPQPPNKAGQTDGGQTITEKINRQKKIDRWMERPYCRHRNIIRWWMRPSRKNGKRPGWETPAAAGDGDQKKGEVMYQVISMYDQCV
jgi:hypothetical protein